MKQHAVLGILFLLGCSEGTEMDTDTDWKLSTIRAPFELRTGGVWMFAASGGDVRFEALGDDPAEIWLEIRMLAHTKTRVLSPGDVWAPWIPPGHHELVMEIFGDCTLRATNVDGGDRWGE